MNRVDCEPISKKTRYLHNFRASTYYFTVIMGEELESVHAVLEKYLPPEELDRVNRILLGNKLQ